MLYQKLWDFENGEEITDAHIDERELEDLIVRNPSILDRDWLLIGEQVSTQGGPLDLLFMEPDGNPVVVELKRNKTPREVTAQALDYASDVSSYTIDDLIEIYESFASRHEGYPATLQEAFEKKFLRPLETDPEDTADRKVKIVIVASRMDDSTERILRFLRDTYQVNINILFFHVYEFSGRRLLGRTWFGEDIEERRDVTQYTQNGYAYVNFGCNAFRRWEDAVRYGFISAGGSRWYAKTLRRLAAGDRIFAYIPQSGYVGYGIVTDPVLPAQETAFTQDGRTFGFSEIEHGDGYLHDANDSDLAEYVVKVRWVHTVDQAHAVRLSGGFSIQHSACKPLSPTWTYTVQKLRELWHLTD
ncbi:MAG: DUF91 domain-containing protein [Oscillospiraceae bacterium]|nr:DUF91 domain-containing protein [Oscillospiraceae bacterium]